MTDLLTFISKILADVPPYYAELVVIGVADASDERVMRDTELFMEDERFRVFDLRGAQDVRGIGALSTDIGDTIRVLLVDNNTATTWLDRLTRAFLDKKDRIDFKEGWVERPKGRSIIVMFYGATNIADLPPLLREPIVQFVNKGLHKSQRGVATEGHPLQAATEARNDGLFPCYSERSATNGSTLVARRAGM